MTLMWPEHKAEAKCHELSMVTRAKWLQWQGEARTSISMKQALRSRALAEMKTPEQADVKLHLGQMMPNGIPRCWKAKQTAVPKEMTVAEARMTIVISNNSKKKGLRVDVSDNRGWAGSRMARPTQQPTTKASMLHKEKRRRMLFTINQAINTIRVGRVLRVITTPIKASNIHLELKLHSNSRTQARVCPLHRWVTLEPMEKVASISPR